MVWTDTLLGFNWLFAYCCSANRKKHKELSTKYVLIYHIYFLHARNFANFDVVPDFPCFSASISMLPTQSQFSWRQTATWQSSRPSWEQFYTPLERQHYSNLDWPIYFKRGLRYSYFKASTCFTTKADL